MLRYRRKKKGHSRGKWLLLSVLLLAVLAAVLFWFLQPAGKQANSIPSAQSSSFGAKAVSYTHLTLPTTSRV